MADKETPLPRLSRPDFRANRLLARLAGAERARFLPACEMVRLEAREVVMGPGQRVTHAYFPLEAIVSLRLAATARQQCFEVALVGAEGMVGIPLLLGGTTSSLQAAVVRPGTALRVAAAPLQLQLRTDPAFSQRVQQYVLVALAQTAQAALCTRYHRVDARLARWLLMMHDRAPPGTVHATHEFLAATLGVRRAGVSRAAESLQQRQLIAYHRGVLELLDREGLAAAACGCYEADRAAYAGAMRLPRG